MTVEVKELIIRAVVSGESGGDSDGQSSGGNEEIIAACVEQILKILERDRER